MALHTKLNEAYNLNINLEKVLDHKELWQLLTHLADSTRCDPQMFLLPLITSVCSLMGVSTIYADPWEEPNIIWSCVVAEKGNRTVNAILLVIKSLHLLGKCGQKFTNRDLSR